jgi:hypothetical protein
VADVFVEQADHDVLQEVTSADLGDGDPRGNARLREVLCGWLATTRRVPPTRTASSSSPGTGQSRWRTLASRRPGRAGPLGSAARPGVRRRSRAGRRGAGTDRARNRAAHPGPPVPHRCGPVTAPAACAVGMGQAGSSLKTTTTPSTATTACRYAPCSPRPPDHVAHTGSTSKTLAPACAWAGSSHQQTCSGAPPPARHGVSRRGVRPAPAGRTDLNETRLVPDDRPGRHMCYVGGQHWVAREAEGQPEYVGVPGRHPGDDVAGER